jgi:hypothetical protein
MYFKNELDYFFSKNKYLTKIEKDYIKHEITKAINNIDDNSCCDNFRMSFKEEDEEEYKKAYNDGCCGFYDDIITLASGRIIKFGFNYGH